MSRKVGGREATTGVIPGEICLSVGKPDRPTPEGWRWAPLLDVARLESGHTPSRRKPEYWGGEVPWIGIKDATGNHGRTILETIQHTNELGIKNSAARILPANTVCLSRTASVGYVVVMGKPMATSQDFANWVCGPDLDHRFLKYALLADNKSLHRFSYGSTHQTIYYPELKAFHVCMPSVGEQAQIADLLGALDDKIELNRRMAATLEEMARALYRSWFVDFDPVKAKAEGLAPAFMDEATAALFPARFGDDGLPEGWSLRSLGEFFKFQRGLSYKGKFLTETGAPMINLGCFKGDGYFDAAKIKNYSGETKERNWVQPGDLVFANTDMTQNRLILGSPHIVEGHSNETFLYSHHVFAGRPTTTESHLWTRFIFFQLLQPEFRERAEGFATGTTVLFLPADAAEALSFAAPDLPLVQAFNNEAHPWLERCKDLRSENQTLTALRDTLLPKLMSGELRVGEAQDQIEEVA